MFTVKELREMSLMSQSEFSKATGIPIRTIGKFVFYHAYASL